uniref:NADH-ubiquinone oxidoreductase chain 4 n=1 Tax=Terebellides stroemii TaxID=1037239 RepID=B3TJX5_9ANNE|nr:NADH dehydrogenase subunit 4 [Terebellides stroemii]ABW76481.1 NADH dehydrogenase subunit 4 [Terebellides stroemii]
MLKLIMLNACLLLLPLFKSKFLWLVSQTTSIFTSFVLIMSYPQTTSISMSPMSIFTDFLNYPLIILTFWISSLMILSSFMTFQNKKSPEMFTFLIIFLNLSLYVCFSSSNILTFYIFFELSLIPTLFLILGWGNQPERLQAGFYLMIYTVTASLPLLMSILFLTYENNSFNFLHSMWYTPHIWYLTKFWWLISITAFMVKMPLYLTHLWLPKAHVEAPVAGSMILAGLLLKLGGYGLIRLSFIFPQNSHNILAPFIAVSLWGAIITGLICLRQHDMKSLIAYSSIGHMGLVISGVMTMTKWGWEGAILMMIAHGLASSAMFSIANSTYEATHSRSLYISKGLISLFPTMSMLFFLLSAANMAAPPSINLVSEISLLTSILSSSAMTAPLIAIISFLAGAYSLFLYVSTQHGSTLSFLNPMALFTQRNYLTLTMHLMPLFIIILKSDILFNWLM